jgi:CHAD domain-containing protein
MVEVESEAGFVEAPDGLVGPRATGDETTAQGVPQAPSAPQEELEQEVKFRVAGTFALPYLGGKGLTHVPGDQRTLDADYWDTADLRLVRRGHLLRYRWSDDGSERQWTLKLGGAAEGDVMVRREVSCPGDPAEPPSSMVDALQGILGGRPLHRVCHLRSDQQRSFVVDADGARRLVVEDDRVSADECDDTITQFREIEIELAPGARRKELDRAARRIQRAGAGEPDPVSKIVRVLGVDAHVASTGSGTIDADITVEDLARAALSNGLERLLVHDPAVRLGLGPEAIHQARVATRRLRADLRTLRPLLRRDMVDPLRDELAWVGGALGAARDLDVLEEQLRTVAQELAPPPDLTQVLQILDVAKAEARTKMLEAVSEPRYLALVHRLERYAAVPPLRDDVAPRAPASDVATKLLRKSWQRLEIAVDDISDASPTAMWHEVRKKAKATRYAAELLHSVVGPAAAQLANRAKRIQNDLGLHHDACNALAWLEQQATTPSLARVAGRFEDVLAVRAHELLSTWERAWAKATRAAATL